MKQPELGRKLAEMRKAKGLTQEDLVAKCNLSVRTIQRIEAGEVVPRGYTIRALFEALEMDWNKTGVDQQPFFLKELPSSLKSSIYFSFGAGVLFLLALIVQTPLDFKITAGSKDVGFELYFLIRLAALVFYSIFMTAFVKIATHSNNLPLRNAFWLMLVSFFVGSCADVYLYYLSALPYNLVGGIIASVAFGVVYLFFGFSLTRFELTMKSVAQPLGVLGIVSGFLFITVVGAVLGVFTMIALYIGLLYFLIWFVKNSSETARPDSAFFTELQS
ncbi:helix-turn-helix domain-containing protein [Algoriphagus aestuariicola]|uniref:Helix-turn-helix domain-containing protein n=1 Tax=Algoriphagus aestuariicola TaxID=1852016 RepID=A0ABS3BK46_9BACT|nr:helix-turn-helix transcriptional regulator [Algoriphagus aestuariicola]MBN7799677.1 helix-turn-helix domain-containing protein [Algoriphagus aestuariicola]